MPNENPTTLYHYCSNQTAVAILSAKTIRISDLTLSNDSMEGRWIRKTIEEAGIKHKLLPAQLPRFLTQVDNACGLLGALGFCLSTKDDMLSQWRGYADAGSGVSIGFSKAYLDKLCAAKPNETHLGLRPVNYDEAAQEKISKTIIEDLTKSFQDTLVLPNPFRKATPEEEKKITETAQNFAIAMLTILPHLFTLKNPAFREEEEWRLYSHILRSGHKADDERLNYRATQDRIVPYQDIPLIDLGQIPITDIVLGPRNITPLPVIQSLLRKQGFSKILIRKSAASFR